MDHWFNVFLLFSHDIFVLMVLNQFLFSLIVGKGKFTYLAALALLAEVLLPFYALEFQKEFQDEYRMHEVDESISYIALGLNKFRVLKGIP